MNLFFKYYNIIIHFYYIAGKLLRIDKISEKDTLFPKNKTISILGNRVFAVVLKRMSIFIRIADK